MKYIYLYILALAVVLAGCNSGKLLPNTRVLNKNKKEQNALEALMNYEEDLSVWRPSYQDSLTLMATVEAESNETEKEKKPVEVKHDVTKELDMFLTAVAAREKQNIYQQGFTLQLYSGDSRQKADNVIKQATSIFPHTWSSMSFKSPFYKVHLGRFMNEQEAYKTFIEAQSSFKSVALVPTQIKLAEL